MILSIDISVSRSRSMSVSSTEYQRRASPWRHVVYILLTVGLEYYLIRYLIRSEKRNTSV
jgi:hypothetical protein